MPNPLSEWFRKNLLRQYKITGIFWEKRGNSWVMRKDVGRFVEEKQGRKYYWFYNHGKSLPVPYDYINAENVINFYKPNRDTTLPFDLSFEKKDGGEKAEAQFQTIDEDLKFFAMQEFRESQNKYLTQEPAWKKLLNNPMIAAFIVLLGSGIFFYILNEAFAQNVTQLTAAVESFKEAISGMPSGGGL